MYSMAGPVMTNGGGSPHHRSKAAKKLTPKKLTKKLNKKVEKAKPSKS